LRAGDRNEHRFFASIPGMTLARSLLLKGPSLRRSTLVNVLFRD
jgi:hypothetical protein